LTRFRSGASLNSKITAHIAAAERHRRDERGALDAGQAAEPVERLIDVTHPLFSIFISGSGQTDPARQHILRIKARMHVHQQTKAAHTKTRREGAATTQGRLPPQPANPPPTPPPRR